MRRFIQRLFNNPRGKDATRINFFVIGVQKGGTTALYRYLSQHPEIQMSSPRKEVHYFDNEDIDWKTTDHNELHKFFDMSAKEVIRGEATPIYIYWPWALPRLYKYNPHSKLILCLRHPTYRAYSGYRFQLAKNHETLSFEEAISTIGRQRVKNSPFGVHRIYSYVERGFYAEQISRLLNLFPRKNILFLRTDMLWTNTSIVLALVERFLGINNIVSKSAQKKYIVPGQSAEIGPISSIARTKLNNIFNSDIMQTSKLTQIDLSDWCNSGYCEPMQPDK